MLRNIIKTIMFISLSGFLFFIINTDISASSGGNMLPPYQIYVNSARDYTDGLIGDGACFTGFYTAAGERECTLRAAIEEANMSPDTNEVLLPSGTYTINLGITKTYRSEGFGNLKIISPVKIRGIGLKPNIQGKYADSGASYNFSSFSPKESSLFYIATNNFVSLENITIEGNVGQGITGVHASILDEGVLDLNEVYLSNGYLYNNPLFAIDSIGSLRVNLGIIRNYSSGIAVRSDLGSTNIANSHIYGNKTAIEHKGKSFFSECSYKWQFFKSSK